MAKMARVAAVAALAVLCALPSALAIASACENVAPNFSAISSTTKYIGLIDNNPSSEITISWSTPNGACIGQWTVETYRKSDNKQIGSAVIKPPQPYQSSSSYTQKTATAGAGYYYKITATAATARVAPVTTTSPVITAAPKPSCSNIQPIASSFAMKTSYIGLVDGNPSSNMELTWSINGACVSSYTVETYRNKDKAKIGSATVSTPAFAVKTLSAGAEYFFKVTPNPADAKVAKTTSTTPVYKAAPAPAPSCSTNAAPKVVRDLRIGDNKASPDGKTAEVWASWANPESPASTCVTTYNYFVSKKGSSTAFISGVNTPASSTAPSSGTQIKGLTPGGTYVFRVEAVNAKGKGPSSQIEFKAWAPMGATPY